MIILAVLYKWCSHPANQTEWNMLSMTHSVHSKNPALIFVRYADLVSSVMDFIFHYESLIHFFSNIEAKQMPVGSSKNHTS